VKAVQTAGRGRPRGHQARVPGSARLRDRVSRPHDPPDCRRRYISFQGPREALTAAQDHASFLKPAWLQTISESSAFEDLKPRATLTGLP
jgi:hypothetical protein